MESLSFDAISTARLHLNRHYHNADIIEKLDALAPFRNNRFGTATVGTLVREPDGNGRHALTEQLMISGISFSSNVASLPPVIDFFFQHLGYAVVEFL
jgi:hypothetical protein